MKFVVKGGGSVLTKKNEKLPAFGTTSELFEHIISNRKDLIRWENVGDIATGCADLVKQGNTVYFVLGGGVFAHPLAKKAGFPRLSVEDKALINYSVDRFMFEVLEVCHKQTDVPIIPLHQYNVGTYDMKSLDLPTSQGLLYVMSSFVSDDKGEDGLYKTLGSDDICMSLALNLKSDYNVMITTQVLKDLQTKIPLSDGVYTPQEFYRNVQFTNNSGDVTGGMAKKVELAVELARKGPQVYIMTPEQFPRFVAGEAVGIKLVGEK